ncbi:MAG: hypothetical protein JNK45_06800 [Myxococcales bacterium]|nr:hypothetical protein [Myxococcales bacterium]
MQRHGLWLGALVILSACGSDASPAEFTTGSSSSGDDPTATTMTSTPGETSSNPTSTTASNTTVDPDSSSGAAESSSTDPTTDGTAESSGPDCPVGTLGCPCDDGACESDATCIAGTCEGQMNCNVDGYEPNDDEASAADLGVLGDGDDPGSIAGELDHDTDVDWFTYAGEDNLGVGPGVAPTRNLDADGGLRLCKFLECPSGIADTEVTCPDGSDLAQSPGGRPGCCGAASIAMPDFNCAGTTDDSAQVYIRVDNAALQCVQYTISYEY